MEEHEIFLILFGIFQENKHVNMAQNGLNMFLKKFKNYSDIKT